jgi:hypothetical protein
MVGMKRMVILFSVFAVAGCSGYEPRVETDRTAPKYQADLAACQESSVAAVDKHNAKQGLDWFSSPVRRPFQIREAIRSCVKSKGYAVTG